MYYLTVCKGQLGIVYRSGMTQPFYIWNRSERIACVKHFGSSSGGQAWLTNTGAYVVEIDVILCTGRRWVEYSSHDGFELYV